MTSNITVLSGGSILSPKGYQAGATYAGLRTYSPDKLDMGLLYSETTATAAGLFTTNLVRSPSVTLSERHIASGRARAVVVNSGCANCCVGGQGLKDAEEMAAATANRLGLATEEVLVCSTGLIGVELPMGLIRGGLGKLTLSDDGGHPFARSILTTDTVVKEIAVSFPVGGETVTLAGCAKGSGMIHPNMATMLAFLTTDAHVDAAALKAALREAADATFNMVSVDGDTSTNDTLLLLANGASGAPELRSGTPEWDLFTEALLMVSEHLAKAVARDGEGASKLIEVVVEGAASQGDARLVARSISSSVLVKTAIHGNDPNWGRIMMAIGKSGAQVDEGRIALYINQVCIMEAGLPVPYFKDALIGEMRSSDIVIRVRMGLGDAAATAWGCNMSEAYVTFNSAYTT